MVELAIEVHISFLLLEQPEDLGVLAWGPYKGERPLVGRRWPNWLHSQMLLRQLCTRVALARTTPSPHACYCWGHITCLISATWAPRLQHQSSMRNRATNGPFKTTGTEQWPVRMCQWIAAMLIQACSAAATTATEGREAEVQTVKLRDDEESYPICKPEKYRLQGGKGTT